MSQNVSHDIVQELGKKYGLTDTQRAVLYEHLQVQLVMAHTDAALKKARETVDALQLQECIVRREYVHTLVKISSQQVPTDAVECGVEQVHKGAKP